jgi:hypothetical protein
MERLHNTDLCDLIGGQLHNIAPTHPASPPIYRKPMPTILGPDGKETPESIKAKEDRIKLEDTWEARDSSWFFTRPWVCDVSSYNLTIINTFLWGMEDMEEFYQSEEFYHGPCAVSFLPFSQLPPFPSCPSYFAAADVSHSQRLGVSASTTSPCRCSTTSPFS